MKHNRVKFKRSCISKHTKESSSETVKNIFSTRSKSLKYIFWWNARPLQAYKQFTQNSVEIVNNKIKRTPKCLNKTGLYVAICSKQLKEKKNSKEIQSPQVHTLNKDGEATELAAASKAFWIKSRFFFFAGVQGGEQQPGRGLGAGEERLRLLLLPQGWLRRVLPGGEAGGKLPPGMQKEFWHKSIGKKCTVFI